MAVIMLGRFIVICEATEERRQSLRSQLPARYEVHAVAPEDFELFATRSPRIDVLIVGHALPELDGRRFIEGIRFRQREIPLIVLLLEPGTVFAEREWALRWGVCLLERTVMDSLFSAIVDDVIVPPN
jgi:CheY-like chemotaxis protein